MQRRKKNRLVGPLIFVAIAIAAVVFAVVGLPKIMENIEGGTTPTADPLAMQEPLFPETEGQVVTYFRVEDNETGEAVAATIDEGAMDWTVIEAPEEADTGLGIDSERLTADLWSLTSLTPNRVLTEFDTLAAYGLDNARYTIEFTTSGGDTYELDLGIQNPGGESYYVRVPNSSDIYLIPTYALEPVLAFLETPPYIQPTPDPLATPSLTPEPTDEDSG